MSHYTQGHKEFEQARTQGVGPWGRLGPSKRKIVAEKKKHCEQTPEVQGHSCTRP